MYIYVCIYTGGYKFSKGFVFRFFFVFGYCVSYISIGNNQVSERVIFYVLDIVNGVKLLSC